METKFCLTMNFDTVYQTIYRYTFCAVGIAVYQRGHHTSREIFFSLC